MDLTQILPQGTVCRPWQPTNLKEQSANPDSAIFTVEPFSDTKPDINHRPLWENGTLLRRARQLY